MPNYENNLIFYKVMNYPIPTNSQYLLFEKNLDLWPYKPSTLQTFSWHKPNPFMHEYIQYINRFWRLYRAIPFIKSIYLCNSISFNALKEDSDIDLFIVTKKRALRRARFFSTCFFVFLWLKRSLKRKTKKFCLSFYITEDADNLYNITLPKTDIYFSYRLAHLIPLYQERATVPGTGDTNIYQANKRLVSILPNFPQQHIIHIGNKEFKGNTRSKTILEFIFWGLRGRVFERIVRLIWLPIMLYKAKKHQEDWWGIVINDRMLKFHLDIRRKVRLNYTLRKKWIHKTLYGVRDN
jgi:hypothetical protein